MKRITERKGRLGLWLTLAMVFAMLMGPGPGLHLVNPDVTDPDAVYLIAGIPIVYAWGIFWFAVQVTIVVIAYRTVWHEDETQSIVSEKEG